MAESVKLKLKNDVVFKAVYGRENEECKEALMALLNLILVRAEDPIVTITYMNPFNIREIYTEKESILDIKVRTESGEILDIEMQILYDPEFIERTVFYHGGMITQALATGESYGKLKKTISIHLLDYIQFQDSSKYHNCFHLREDEDGFELTSLVEMHYLEFPKVNPGRSKKPEELTEVERLLEFLRCVGEDGSEGYCNCLKQNGGKEIAMTDNILQRVTEEEIIREKAIARDKYLHQQASIARGLKRLEEMEKLEARLETAEGQNEALEARLENAEGQKEELEAKLENAEKQHKSQMKTMINAFMQIGETKESIMEITKLTEAELEEYLK